MRIFYINDQMKKPVKFSYLSRVLLRSWTSALVGIWMTEIPFHSWISNRVKTASSTKLCIVLWVLETRKHKIIVVTASSSAWLNAWEGTTMLELIGFPHYIVSRYLRTGAMRYASRTCSQATMARSGSGFLMVINQARHVLWACIRIAWVMRNHMIWFCNVGALNRVQLTLTRLPWPCNMIHGIDNKFRYNASYVISQRCWSHVPYNKIAKTGGNITWPNSSRICPGPKNYLFMYIEALPRNWALVSETLSECYLIIKPRFP